MSEQTPELNKALAAVQKQLPNIKADQTANVQTKTGGSYSYSYADLADINPKVLPLLGQNGLSWTTRPTLQDGHFVLAYELRHESGEYVGGFYPLHNTGGPQDIGKEITYARRYALCAVVGIAAGGDDDDGAAAQKAVQQPRKQAPSKASVPKNQETGFAGGRGPSEPQRKKLHALIGEIGMSRDEGLAFMAGWIGHEISTTNELTVAEASTVIDKLQIMRDTELREDGIDPETGEYV